MKMIYKEPEIEIIFFKAEDHIRASATTETTATEAPEDQLGDAESDFIDYGW
ncbi:MAG: hypothetical protein IJD93_03380 [Ruminococcus sp.]|nr:hypothetical protein [Ruminococcus sp.]